MKNIIICISFFAGIQAQATVHPLAIANIPDSLTKYADVIKRNEELHFVINEKNRATYTIKVAYTILNERGSDWATYQVRYDKLQSVESFKGTLYDAVGNKIKALKKSDIRDLSGFDDESLIDDNRVKQHTFYHKIYPYSVEYEIEMRYKGTMFLPVWQPQEKNNMTVLQSQITVSVPANNPLHYKLFASNQLPVITTEKDAKIYSWQVSNLSAMLLQYAMPSWRELTPTLFLTTEKFMLEDYEGSNTSWKDFGKFIYELTKGREQLPADLKAKIHQLIAGAKTNKDKIERLYTFMQQNTRYIGIQLGIGGWQPFDATYVATKKYGDCKALSNFMYALLKEAGIKSLYTVIQSGGANDYLIEELPGSQFNHVVLLVPQGKDSIWLECTSQITAPGYMSGNTANRLALAVDENGGRLVRTPAYLQNENRQLRKTTATIDATGNLKATIATEYAAMQQERLHTMVNGLSKDKLKEFLNEELDLPNYDITSFEYNEQRSKLPLLMEKLEIVSTNYASVSGKRFFLNPNIFTRNYRKINADENRKTAIVLSVAYKDVDTTEIDFPMGYTAESLPKDVAISSEFGNYEASVKLIDNKIVYYRKYESYNGRFAAASYTKLVKFYDDVYKADRSKVVLLKNETEVPSKGF